MMKFPTAKTVCICGKTLSYEVSWGDGTLVYKLTLTHDGQHVTDVQYYHTSDNQSVADVMAARMVQELQKLDSWQRPPCYLAWENASKKVFL
jgi:hypothetical protein